MEEQDPRTDDDSQEPPPVRPGDYPPGTYADLTPYTYLENRRCVEPECWAPLPDIGDRPGLFSPRCIPHREARLKEKQKGDRHKRPHPKDKPVSERKPRETKQTVAARCQRWKDALCAAVADEGIAVAEGLRRLDVSMSAYERQRSRDPVFRANIDRAKLVGKGHDTDTRRGDLPFGEFAQLYFHRTHFTHQLRMIDEIERLDAQDVVMILASPESGKALACDTLIPIVRGSGERMGLAEQAFSKIGDLAVGATVYAADGTPTRVTGVYPQAPQDCYRVTFSDHTSVIASADHQWVVRSRRGGATNAELAEWFPSRRYPAYTATTADLLASGIRVSADERPNHAVPVPQALDAPAEYLPLDPYTLGFWLGNGDKRSGRITINQLDYDDVTFNIAEGGNADLGIPTPGRGCTTITVLGIHTQLRQLGVLGNKHIPALYLRGAAEDRWALLAGLLDSDGHCDKKGRIEYTTTDAALDAGFGQLLRTLGIKFGRMQDRARLNGKDCGARYRYNLMPHRDVFRVARKAARQITVGNDRDRWRTITAIEPVPTVPTVCIAVEHPSHTYVFGEQMLVTHNTSTLEDYINKTLAQDPTHRFRIVSESQDLAIRIVGACARRFRETEIYPAFIARYGPFYEKGQERAYAKPWTSNQLTLWKNPGTERDRNLVAQSWNGANYGSRIDTLIIDDVISQRNVGQSQEIFERIRGTFFNRGVEMRTIIIGTRIKPGDFYDKMDDAGLVTRHIYIPATGGLGAGPGEPTTPEMWQYRLKHSGTACCPPGIDRTCPKNGEWLSPKEYLDLIRFKAGEETWWASYMQNPRDDAVSTFGANLDDCKDKERTIGRSDQGLTVLSIDPALGGGTALVAASLGADRLAVLDSHNVRGLAKTEQQIELIEQYARRYRPAILIVEYDAQQKGLGNDDRLRALGRSLGFQIVPHITRGQKFDVPYAVASMNQSFIRREISIPWGDPETVDKMEQLVYQLRGWRIPEEGKKDRQVQDLVMALWFIWRYWMGHRDGGGERYAPAKRPSWVPRDPRRHLHAPVSR